MAVAGTVGDVAIESVVGDQVGAIGLDRYGRFRRFGIQPDIIDVEFARRVGVVNTDRQGPDTAARSSW